jgi:CubicO group peptidase (beta-lactamase class C family)
MSPIRRFHCAPLARFNAWCVQSMSSTRPWVLVAVGLLIPSLSPAAKLDPSALNQMDHYFESQVTANEAAGYVLLVEERGKVVHQAAIGFQNRERQVPMSLDSRFRIASMTKPIVATVILQLRDEGKLDLNDPVSNYLPEFKSPAIYEGENEDGRYKTHPATRAPTIKELLTHTSGLAYSIGANPNTHYGQALYAVAAPATQSLQEFSEKLAQLPFLYEPGQNWVYSYSFDVLGRVIEVVTGQSLEHALRERIFTPLQMTHTSFYVDPKDQAQLATVYRHTADHQLVESTLPLLAQATTEHAWASGGGGLVSTIEDYRHFASMLLHQGQWRHRQILKATTVNEMTSPQVDAAQYQHYWGLSGRGQSYGLGLGMVLNAAEVPWPTENGEFSWGGALDTHWIANPKRDLLAIIMTQIDPTTNTKPQMTDVDFHRLVYGAIAQTPSPHHGHHNKRQP